MTKEIFKRMANDYYVLALDDLSWRNDQEIEEPDAWYEKNRELDSDEFVEELQLYASDYVKSGFIHGFVRAMELIGTNTEEQL